MTPGAGRGGGGVVSGAGWLHKLLKVRPRINQQRFLQPTSYFVAFKKIYKICVARLVFGSSLFHQTILVVFEVPFKRVRAKNRKTHFCTAPNSTFAVFLTIVSHIFGEFSANLEFGAVQFLCIFYFFADTLFFKEISLTLYQHLLYR